MAKSAWIEGTGDIRCQRQMQDAMRRERKGGSGIEGEKGKAEGNSMMYFLYAERPGREAAADGPSVCASSCPVLSCPVTRPGGYK